MGEGVVERGGGGVAFIWVYMLVPYNGMMECFVVGSWHLQLIKPIKRELNWMFVVWSEKGLRILITIFQLGVCPKYRIDF